MAKSMRSVDGVTRGDAFIGTPRWSNGSADMFPQTAHVESIALFEKA